MKALVLPLFAALGASTILGCGVELALLLLQTIANSDFNANGIFLWGALTTFVSFGLLAILHISKVAAGGF